MLDKTKCREWAKSLLALMKITQHLSDDEAEYIILREIENETKG